MTRIIPFPVLQALNTRFLGQSVRKLFLPFLAFVFAFTANAQSDIPGCTDSTACNFNVEATVDDGSCEFTSCADIYGLVRLSLDDGNS